MQGWCHKPFKIAVSITFSAGSAATACRRPRIVSGKGKTFFLAHWFAQWVFSVLAILVLLTAGLIISVKGPKIFTPLTMNIFGLHCYVSLVFAKSLKSSFNNTDSHSPFCWSFVLHEQSMQASCPSTHSSFDPLRFKPITIWHRVCVHITYVKWMFLWELGVTGRCKVSSTPGCGRGVHFLFTLGMLVIIWRCKQSGGKEI